jgi:pimeloyl-ACP methyl ester carboxylesterase
MNVYFISGLGADRKAFQKIILPSKYIIHHIDWITPFPKESLQSYAKRLTQSIDQSRPFAVIGLSFGGMLAATISTYLQPQATVLISSIGSFKELPWYFQRMGQMHFYKCIPTVVLNKPNKIAHWLFGAKRPSEKALLDHIIVETNPQFIKWAFGAILTWNLQQRPSHLFHIHGDKDKILPAKYTHADVIIEGGSHFLVWTKGDVVSKFIISVLEKCHLKQDTSHGN